MQRIGLALHGRIPRDPRDNRPVDASLAEYLLPVNRDTGALEVLLMEEAGTRFNPLGTKASGTIALIRTAPGMANAMHRATGWRVRDLPQPIASLCSTRRVSRGGEPAAGQLTSGDVNSQRHPIALSKAHGRIRISEQGGHG